MADLVAERDQLIEHPARAARQDLRALDRVDGRGLIRHLGIGLDHVQRLSRHAEAVPEEGVIIGKPVAGICQIRFGLRV